MALEIDDDVSMACMHDVLAALTFAPADCPTVADYPRSYVLGQPAHYILAPHR